MDVICDFSGEKRNIFVDNDDDAGGEHENAHGFDAEKEIVVRGIIFRVFQNECGMIVLKFNTRGLVGVDGRSNSMFVHLVFINEPAALGLVRHDVDFNQIGRAHV